MKQEYKQAQRWVVRRGKKGFKAYFLGLEVLGGDMSASNSIFTLISRLFSLFVHCSV